jgi:hypothetical protein
MSLQEQMETDLNKQREDGTEEQEEDEPLATKNSGHWQTVKM